MVLMAMTPMMLKRKVRGLDVLDTGRRRDIDSPDDGDPDAGGSDEGRRSVLPGDRRRLEGAEILGIHFEGPYLDMEYKGAQPPEAIAQPSVEQFKQYQAAARGWIKYITLSPEHDTGSIASDLLYPGVGGQHGSFFGIHEETLMAPPQRGDVHDPCV